MLIDWFTVAAQALNFFVLVWLLKRFLYTPILRAIDAREQRIATRLADAEQRKAEARAERETYQRKNADFERQRQQLLQEAALAAQSERRQLLETARREAQAARDQWYAALRGEARELEQILRRRTRQEIFAIARKALRDLAGASLEQRLCDVFIARLRELEGSERDEFTQALRATGQACVRSAFEPNTAQRELIEQVIAQLCGARIALRFELAPEQVDGIALRAGGHEVAWSIAEYLDAMERSIGDLLRRPADADAALDDSGSR